MKLSVLILVLLGISASAFAQTGAVRERSFGSQYNPYSNGRNDGTEGCYPGSQGGCPR
jgi:hypothetical protein